MLGVSSTPNENICPDCGGDDTSSLMGSWGLVHNRGSGDASSLFVQPVEAGEKPQEAASTPKFPKMKASPSLHSRWLFQF